MQNVDIIVVSPGRHRIFSPFGGSIVLTARGLLELATKIEENREILQEEAQDEMTQKLPDGPYVSVEISQLTRPQ